MKLKASDRIKQQRSALVAELLTINDEYQGEPPEEVGKRVDEIEAALPGLDVQQRRALLLEGTALTAPGVALNDNTTGGGGREVRAFASGPSLLPADFDGQILISQYGDRIPVLEARHGGVASLLPQGETASHNIGVGRYFAALYRGARGDEERAALGEGSIGGGGAMLPDPLAAELIDAASAQSVAIRGGARVIPTTSASLKWARMLTLAQGAFRFEHAPIVENEPSMDLITTNAKSFALLLRVSRELTEDAANLDAVLRSQFSTTASLAIDHAALWGSGVAPEPLGAANTPGVQVVDMGAAAGAKLLNYAPFLDAQAKLAMANSGPITAAVMSPNVARTINGFVDTSGQPLQPPRALAGIPFLTTTAASIAESHGTASNSSSIVTGDFSQIFICMRTALQVSVLTEKYADVGEIGYVCWLRFDIAIARPSSLAKITGIIP